MGHGPIFYLVPWVVALLLALSAFSVITRIPIFKRLIVRQEVGRETRSPRYYRFGGITLAVLFLILLISDARLEWNAPFVALWIGSLAIIAFSFADDIGHVGWPWHLSFQILLGILVFSSGMRFDVHSYFQSIPSDWPGVFSLIGSILWVVLIMNALNWVDGTDGLMPGIAAFSFGTIFMLALRPEVNQPTIAILSMTLLGLSLGLLFFNWHPAKILAGTGGAYFFGFALATIALYAGTKVATLLMVLAIPVFDALFVLVRRLVEGRSLFLPDQAHLHHLLLARGWHPAAIASAYLFCTALLGLLAVALQDGSKAFAFTLAGALLALATFSLHWSLRNNTSNTRRSLL